MNKILIGLCGSKTFENKAKIKMFIFKLKEQTDSQITIVGMGDKDGADKYIKKYALEFGYEYREMNPPHTPKSLYSLMSEAYYNKPYSSKNFFLRNQISKNPFILLFLMMKKLVAFRGWKWLVLSEIFIMKNLNML
jgi:hypothetical protein